MDTLLQHFIDHLEAEYDFLQTYLEALHQQTLAVIDGNTQEIIDSTSSISDMIVRNRAMQKTRQALLERLAKEFALDGGQVSIPALLPHVSKQWVDRLMNQQQRLDGILRQIRVESESNTYLLRYAIDFTHSIIQLSDRAIKQQLGYARNGTRSLATSKKLLDHKA